MVDNILLAQYTQTILTINGFFCKKGAEFKGAKILPENGENVENKIWKKVCYNDFGCRWWWWDNDVNFFWQFLLAISLARSFCHLSGRASLVAKRLFRFWSCHCQGGLKNVCPNLQGSFVQPHCVPLRFVPHCTLLRFIANCHHIGTTSRKKHSHKQFQCI